MKTFVAIFATAVYAGLAAAVKFTNSAYDVTAGEPFTLKWTEGTGPYTITLKDGPSSNLKDVEELVQSTTDDSFTWTPSKTLTSGTYAFEIKDAGASTTNYSPQWSFQGSAASTGASSTSATGTSSTTSGSSTASSTATPSSATTSSASTTGSSSSATPTSASKTSMTTSTRTSSTTTTSTSAPNANDARGLAAPIIAPLLLAAVAAF